MEASKVPDENQASLPSTNGQISNEVEASVLGAVLKDGMGYFKELLVQEAHFTCKSSQISPSYDGGVIKMILSMVTVTTKLGDAITQVGGTTYFLEMGGSVASTAAMKHHERLVFDGYRAKMSKACA